ncbi:hypothetical protein L208DRAFT_1386249 [Tricholoma matsutake]|nr:hypothetical protein L208DRAFT_1386249 [Tricholoma matsutake 945]
MSKIKCQKVETTGKKPGARGYHSVGNVMTVLSRSIEKTYSPTYGFWTLVYIADSYMNQIHGGGSLE